MAGEGLRLVIATAAGTLVEDSRIETITLEQTAWAKVAAPRDTTAAGGDPCVITTREGAPVMTGSIVRVQPTYRHHRLIVRPLVLVDMDMRTVPPTTLQDTPLPDVLAAALGPHAVTVGPSLRSLRVPFWTTGARPQQWVLESVIRSVRWFGHRIVWRYSARDDEIQVYEPGGDEGRMAHTIDGPLFARGGALEVSAVDYQVQAGDELNGDPVLKEHTCWTRRVKRTLAWT